MLLNQISWDVSPVIFSLGSLHIRWYGLFFALSFYLGYVILEKQVFKREGLPVGLLDRLATYVVIGTVVGARLGHVLFYEPASYLRDPISILKIWEGGLASHGAAIGILLALWIFKRKSGKSYLWTLDRLVIVVALGGFFIRMGNLMNSEIYGHYTSLPWGFVFLRDGETEPRHPTQIYEALSYLILFFILLKYYISNYKKLKEGFIFGVFLIVLFGVRFLIEFVKEPQVAFEQTMTLNMGQWLSIPFILAGAGLLWRTSRKK
ncbi:prolipoprotein diacylglyceryl transferase [Lentimicrobium sp.]|uniref:prolipoprotein diacylglyceryl transferase n=1 Tax=Lentimicrobium sp. TaxID=2034841 RepID=UPI0025F79FEA|nr:prolipoprotein diacylglyceryl transferase [Lentimicrobium sp.]MCO5257187.1 prolipoprotein diacylglyceryl transferase [Lentimicrobium sp.]MCO5262234.1 prolipoprotein diacylglyceryl transferase [Lentimicrobium sp.]HOP12373.1 prolipoprotein diacylglyceryl transferase [Lentimicrobium sp.]HPF64056.1 prolipoprotein diacylglyceryl transferase [Lentimicrobium sp.]HPR25164.1 prolipoprotein diacylglyceryl transferase [Lentimicrobium sp.]